MQAISHSQTVTRIQPAAATRSHVVLRPTAHLRPLALHSSTGPVRRLPPSKASSGPTGSPSDPLYKPPRDLPYEPPSGPSAGPPRNPPSGGGSFGSGGSPGGGGSGGSGKSGNGRSFPSLPDPSEGFSMNNIIWGAVLLGLGGPTVSWVNRTYFQKPLSHVYAEDTAHAARTVADDAKHSAQATKGAASGASHGLKESASSGVHKVQSAASRATHAVTDPVVEGAYKVSSTVSGKAQDLKHGAEHVVHSAALEGSHKLKQAENAAWDTKEGAKGKAKEVKGAAKDAASSTKGKVQDTVEAGQEVVEKKSSGLFSGFRNGVDRLRHKTKSTADAAADASHKGIEKARYGTKDFADDHINPPDNDETNRKYIKWGSTGAAVGAAATALAVYIDAYGGGLTSANFQKQAKKIVGKGKEVGDKARDGSEKAKDKARDAAEKAKDKASARYPAGNPEGK